ncbi:MAG: tetratricopeptide repeat protein [Candidatus Krumholzibacteriia bacterium]
MTKRNPTTSPTAQDLQDRKVKLAEGGIILGLIVALCVFLGIHFAHDSGPTVAARLPRLDTPPTTAQMIDEPVVASTPAAAVDDGTEPVVTVAAPEPEPVAVTYAASEEAYAEGRYDEAADLFARYCDEHPGNAWGHYMRGLSLWKAGRDQAAEAAFEAALALKPDHVKSLVNLARVQLELARPEAALASVELAIDLAPENADAHRVLGRVNHTLGRLDAAVSAYTDALDLRADDAWTLNNLALVWIEQARFTDALPALARAAELAPEAGVIRNNLATALEGSGHLSQAMEQFELAAAHGSAKGELSLTRLSAVTLPAAEPVADLAALAAAWKEAADALDPARPAGEAVASVITDDAER